MEQESGDERSSTIRLLPKLKGAPARTSQEGHEKNDIVLISPKNSDGIVTGQVAQGPPPFGTPGLSRVDSSRRELGHANLG